MTLRIIISDFLEVKDRQKYTEYDTVKYCIRFSLMRKVDAHGIQNKSILLVI